MWIVTVNRPYYPSVYEFDNQEDAQKCYDLKVVESNDYDGVFNCAVYIAEVKSKTTVKSHY